MATRDHVHEEVFATDPAPLFALLHTPSAIRRWWSAARAIVVPEAGGLWLAAWGDDEDDPEYVSGATIAVFEPPRRLVLSDWIYRARSGPPPPQADMRTTFEVEPCEGGARLRVTQQGFPASPEGEAFLSACRQGWTDTFAGIRRFLAERGA